VVIAVTTNLSFLFPYSGSVWLSKDAYNKGRFFILKILNLTNEFLCVSGKTLLEVPFFLTSLSYQLSYV